MTNDIKQQIADLTDAYQAGHLSEVAYQAAVAALRQQATYSADADRGSAVAQNQSTALAKRAANVQQARNVVTGDKVVIVEEGGVAYLAQAEPEIMSAVNRETALGRYLDYVIASNRYLQLQGISAGGRVINIELDHIYITLRATQQRTVSAEERWLAQEAALAPGEHHRHRETGMETVTVSVNEALATHRRLVVLGDPGCGKTTLLRFLALVYGRDMSQGGGIVHERLGLADTGLLPIALPLRQLGAYLDKHGDPSVEGHGLMVDFILAQLHHARLDLPGDFFDSYLQTGHAAILLDGLDEVADLHLRRRVARLVEDFTRAYGDCRYVVTSRLVGYTGAARLGEQFATSTVRDFTLDDVAHFLGHWHKAVAVGQMGSGASATAFANEQTRHLSTAIRDNDRIRELAINPLMLTVIALVHRDNVKLPDRRAELYAKAVDVLLGEWDEAKGLSAELMILPGHSFDTGDRRLVLQSVALHMHEARQKEIEAESLRALLAGLLADGLASPVEVDRAVDRFLGIIEERSGLLTARGEGIFTFSHLTFQEYLAALAVAGRDDYIAYSLARSGDSWWREVILLEAGYLSTQGKERPTRLIRAIADNRNEPDLFHNLILAADCLRDVGNSRTQGDLAGEVTERLWAAFQAGPTGWYKIKRQLTSAPDNIAERRIAAATAWTGIGQQTFWSMPNGEPEWVEIPTGEFIMGSGPDDHQSDQDEWPQHRLKLDTFWIARVPTTNAQYALFVRATGHAPPRNWGDSRVPRGLESHPVIGVSWRDAVAYCYWLAGVTGKNVTLPSEAEWEKAARGPDDARVYPWGETFEPAHANSGELSLGTTTPVGIFPEGASPYGVLDLSGNVFEWTRSRFKRYKYDPADGREEMGTAADDSVLVARGGSYSNDSRSLRCAYRYWSLPGDGDRYCGFRVVVSPFLTADL